MAGLQAERRRHRRKARVERRHLHLDAGFLLLVGKGLPHAAGRKVGGIRKANLVVFVIGGAGPEPDGIDRSGVRPVFALGRELGLVRVDPGLVIGAVDTGDAIERVVLRDGCANEAAMEEIGTAEAPSVCAAEFGCLPFTGRAWSNRYG
jgi:hypothetical protein